MELEQALIIDALRSQIGYKEQKQSRSKSDSFSLSRIKESNEILKKENQNLKRLLLSSELIKEKVETNEKRLKLRVYRQERENKSLINKISTLNNIKLDKANENSKYCQFDTLTQKNSLNLIGTNNHYPLIKKNVFRTRSSSRKNSLKNQSKHLRTKSLLSSSNHSFSKAKRNRSALDISTISRNQQAQHSSRFATERAVIKSYFNASLIKKPKQNYANFNGKRNVYDMRHSGHFVRMDRKNDSLRLCKKNSKLHTQI